MIISEWYGCPHCSSKNCERHDELEPETIRISYQCQSCRKWFPHLLLWWIEDEDLDEENS
jgi:DNA-directed RNA polymerase subunit RPC12/RpoP